MGATTGYSASMNGDRLLVDVTTPAFPQSAPKQGLQGGTELIEPGLGDGDLLIRQGFQVTGSAASDQSDVLAADDTPPAFPQSRQVLGAEGGDPFAVQLGLDVSAVINPGSES